MNFTAWNDEASRLAYERARYLLDDPIAKLFPDYVLSTLGVIRKYRPEYRLDERDEIIIKLHLMPIGEVNVLDPGSFTKDPARPSARQDITPEDLHRLEQAYLRLK